MPSPPLEQLKSGVALDCLDLSTHNCRDFKVCLKVGEVEEETEEEVEKNQESFELLEGLVSRFETGAPSVRALDLSFCDLGSNDLGASERNIETCRKKMVLCKADISMCYKDEQKARKENDFSKRTVALKKMAATRDNAQATLEATEEELKGHEERMKDTPWWRLVDAWQKSGGCQLQMLSLKNCCLQATGARVIGDAILHMENESRQADKKDTVKPLRRLYLDGNNLGNEGGEAIGYWLRQCNFLDELSLRNCGFTDEGVSAIVAGLVENKTLTSLDIRENRAFNSAASVSAIKGFNQTCDILL